MYSIDTKTKQNLASFQSVYGMFMKTEKNDKNTQPAASTRIKMAKEQKKMMKSIEL